MISVSRFVGRAMTAVSLMLMALLCIPISYEAVARAFNAPTIWVFETTLYAFIFLGFLGNALAVQAGAHFRVSLLPEMFPEKRWLFDLIGQVATLVFAILIMASGIYFMWYSISNRILSASLLEIPLWIPQLAIPLGGLGLLLQTLVQMVTGEKPVDSHGLGD
jgi:TRAP-type C4-dicarboxylate transport system permease small subunit